MSAKRGHLLIVTKSDDWTEDDPAWSVRIECQAPALCSGWQECLKEHEVDGMSAHEGPYEGCPGSHLDSRDGPTSGHLPWCDEDEFLFHGEWHEWRWGHGWTVPFDGCVVAWQASEGWCDSAWGIAYVHGSGTYEVDDDWDDEVCTLILIERVSQ